MEKLLSYIRTFKANNIPFDECDKQEWINAWTKLNPNISVPDLSQLKYLEYSKATILFDGSRYYALDDHEVCIEVRDSMCFNIDIGSPIDATAGSALL